MESKVDEKITKAHKNMWLEKLLKDLLQNRYNLKKVGLYNGPIKKGIEYLLNGLKDYDM